MTAVVQGAVSAIESLTPTTGSRLVATALIVALLVVLGEAVRRLGPRLKERFGVLAVETVQTAAVALVLGLAGLALVVLWGATEQLALALSTLNVSRADTVKLVLTAALVAGSYALTRATKRVIVRLARERGAISRHQQEVAHHLVQTGVYVLALLMVLSLWRVQVGNLLLGAGVLGVVIGLAARQTLGAVLAGFVVLFARPFELGDWVEIGDNEGVVTDISIFNTEIRTFDGELVLVPNDVVTSTEVVNRSRLGRYRVEVDVGVDYEADLDRAAAVAAEAIGEVDLALAEPSPRVVFTRFGDSAVGLRLRFWIDEPEAGRMWRARTQVIGAVKAAFEAEGIEIPFPQRELMARNEAGGFELAGPRAEAADGEGE